MHQGFYSGVSTATANARRRNRHYRHTLVKGGGMAVPPDWLVVRTTKRVSR